MSLPEPLTPEGCDLRSHTYFPLHYDRLLRSKWWRRASDFARSRNMDLWAHAFREVPAASLPDDDADLADMAGFGRDIEAFVKAKAELLEPWILCADGRWYHATLAEVACDLWDRMDGKRRANRERQQARRVRLKVAAVTPEGAAVTRDTPTTSRVTGSVVAPPVTLDSVDVTPKSGPKEIKEINQGSNEPVASAPPKATARAAKGEPWDRDEHFLMLWNAATPEMRRRAKSKANVWPDWVKSRKATAPDVILGGLAIYLLQDPDVKRTGGPGLHLWLRQRTWETYSKTGAAALIGADWSDDTWSEVLSRWRADGTWDPRLGPVPGHAGCRAPTHLLAKPIDGAPA